jgi:DNA-binding transcriptional MerR regulator
MRIGEAARETGTTVKAIRHYEALGLLGTLPRDGRYRELSTDDLARLRLITHCRELGFSLAEIRKVIGLVVDAEPSCPDPEAMLQVVDRRLQAIGEQVDRLRQLGERLGTTRTYLQRRLTASQES